MKLVSPIGVVLRVSDEQGEKLLTQGYKEVGAKAPAAPVKRTRRKTAKEPKDGASDT